MSARYLATSLFLLAGIIVAVIFAKFKAQDYRHASITVKKGGAVKHLSINDYSGRQVIALSLRNQHTSKDIEVRMDGAQIQSWYPPVIKMPFHRGVDVKGGRFNGVSSGKRIPLYLIINGKDGGGKIEIIDSSNGSLIQTVHVMRGGFDERHH
jgi:hypothetical protein